MVHGFVIELVKLHLRLWIAPFAGFQEFLVDYPMFGRGLHDFIGKTRRKKKCCNFPQKKCSTGKPKLSNQPPLIRWIISTTSPSFTVLVSYSGFRIRVPLIFTTRPWKENFLYCMMSLIVSVFPGISSGRLFSVIFMFWGLCIVS